MKYLLIALLLFPLVSVCQVKTIGGHSIGGQGISQNALVWQGGSTITLAANTDTAYIPSYVKVIVIDGVYFNVKRVVSVDLEKKDGNGPIGIYGCPNIGTIFNNQNGIRVDTLTFNIRDLSRPAVIDTVLFKGSTIKRSKKK